MASHTTLRCVLIRSGETDLAIRPWLWMIHFWRENDPRDRKWPVERRLAHRKLCRRTYPVIRYFVLPPPLPLPPFLSRVFGYDWRAAISISRFISPAPSRLNSCTLWTRPVWHLSSRRIIGSRGTDAREGETVEWVSKQASGWFQSALTKQRSSFDMSNK